MKCGKIEFFKHSKRILIARVIALMLVAILVMSGSGLTVLAQGIGENSSEVSFAEENTDESTEEFSEEAESQEVVEESEVSEEYSEPDEFNEAETQATNIASGVWGESVHWTLDSEGTLTITQDETVAYEYFSDEEPWTPYASQVNKMIWGANCFGTDGYNVWSAIDFGECVYDEELGMWTNDFTALEEIVFTENIDTSYLTTMSAMFEGCSKLKYLDLHQFDTSNVSEMSYMFANCSELTFLDISNFNTKNVRNMSAMFYLCENLVELDLSNFVTENVIGMSSMFSWCTKLQTLNLSSFSTNNVVRMNEMFCGCNNLKNLDISSFDTSKVEDMSYMFCSCTSLERININHFNTKKVTNMEAMFSGCNSLKVVELLEIDTSNVRNFSGMFQSASCLEEIDLSKFSTDSANDMTCMFAGCSSLKSLDLRNFNTSNVTNMNGMFSQTNLTEIDLSGFDTSNVADMSYMFYVCKKLKKVNLDGFSTKNLKDMSFMFISCFELEEIDLSDFDLSNLENAEYAFSDIFEADKIEAPRNLNIDIPLEGNWIRTDTGEIISVIPKGLNESITLQCTGLIEVTKVTLEPTELYLEENQTYPLVIRIEPSNVTDNRLEWKTSDESVATVDYNGLVTAHKAGEAIISIRALGGTDVTATCKVTVAPIAQMATGLKVEFNKNVNADGEYVLAINDSVAPTITWDNGDPWPEVVYSVSNDTAAIEDGKLVAKRSGTGTLTVTAKNGDVTGPSASVNYRVYAEKVSGIKLNAEKVILDAQARNAFLLEATIDNADVAYADVEFSVDKPESIIFINQGENKTYVVLKDTNPITATVTATATDGSGKSATCTIVSGTCVNSITVSAPLETGADGAYLLGEGKSAKLTAGILPANATVKTVTWTSSDETVAKVDANGTVTAVKPGIAFIYATTTDGSGVNGTAVINVTRPASAVKLELLGGENGKVGLYSSEAGSEFEVKAILSGADGKTDNVIQEVNYTVSGKGAKNVTYLGNGRFVATAPGVVTVTATAKDGSKVKASMQITIEQHVYAFDVQTPKNIGKYDDPRGENWIVYLGAKDVTITPSVTYNEGIKEYAPAKAYQNYVFEFEQTEKGTLTKDKKGTGIFISKDTAPGVYGVEITNEDSGICKHIYVAVIPADVTFIRTVTIDLPKTVASTEDAFQPIAEGSKVKLTGVLNGGESTKGCALTWSVEGEEGNAGTATVSKAGVLDLSKAKVGDNYKVILNVSKGGSELGGVRYITVTKKPDASAMKFILAENENEALPSSFNVQYVNNGKVFKVAEQIGAANLYSVTGGKKGVLTLEETENGYVVLAEGTGTAKITITALDGSNVKKAITVKVVSAGNPVSKLTTGSKKYSVEPNMPIAIPYSVVTKNGKAASDARVEWTSSNAGILQVSAGSAADAEGSCITTEEKGYLTLVAGTGMTGKVTLTGKALDGSKKTVKVTVNVVNSGKKEVTYKMSLQTPAKTPNGGVPGLALVTYGKSVKLTANVFPNKAKNKTISYTIVGLGANGQQTLSEAELKAKGVTVKKGVVAASKKSSYTGYVKVTATLDYMTYVMGEATPITAEKTLYVQPGVTKVEITGADGKVMKTATVEAGTSLVLNAKVTGAGALTYSNVSWSVSDSKLASVNERGCVTIKAGVAKGKKVKVTATALDGSKKKAVVTITIK